MTSPVEDIRAKQTLRWNEEEQTYVPVAWTIQVRRSVVAPWEDLKVLNTYIGGPAHGKSTIDAKDIDL